MTPDRRSIIGGAGAIAAGVSFVTSADAASEPAGGAAPEGRVLGLGGIFLKVPDEKAWRAWYYRVLGVKFTKFGTAAFPYPKKGLTQLAPFADTSYFKPSEAPFMINLVVENMDAVVAKAEAQGVHPVGRQDESYGRFAWLMDPAGIKVELWEPLSDHVPEVSAP